MIKNFLDSLKRVKTSECKNPKDISSRICSLDTLEGSFKQLINICKKIKNEEIEQYCLNIQTMKNNKQQHNKIQTIQQELKNCMLDGNDFI